jgi:hypothetical protein
MADALEWLLYVQLNGVKIDLIPGQAENFTSAQAEDENENENEGSVESFARVPGRLKEPASVIDGPGLALAALSRLATFGHLDSGNRVTGDCLVFNCARQRGV